MQLSVAKVRPTPRRRARGMAYGSGLRCSSTGVPIDDHDGLGARDDGRVGARVQTALGQRGSQHRLRAVLAERQLAGSHLLHGGLVDVVEADVATARGERDRRAGGRRGRSRRRSTTSWPVIEAGWSFTNVPGSAHAATRYGAARRGRV